MVEIHDEELMMNFQQGNVHAFELLFEKYRVPVFNFIYRMLNRKREPAEDLLQEIFVKLNKAKDFYEPRTKFSTWLFTIARNHCLNFIKSQRYLRAKNTVSLDARDNEDALSLLERLPAKEESRPAIEQKEIQEMLEQAICALPDDYKDVFLLRAVEGFTHQEVSRILKMNPATVRTQYHRARLKLREKIGYIFDSMDVQRR